jgi:type I restriction enzyme S subunit
VTSWQQVSLGDVLRLDLDKIAVDPATDYEMVGVLSFGRGLFHREPVNGGSTSYKTFYRLGEEHIVMSQLFGWEGALALSNDEFAGKYVSTQFPTFLVDNENIDRRFLGWWMRQVSVWDELKGKAKGMGDRRRTLNPDALLTCSIELPPLIEQRRIVAKIESLAARIDAARQLRQAIQSDMDSLLVSMAHRNDLSDEEKEGQGWQRVALGEVLTQVSDPVEVQPGGEYPHFGIYSFAKGLFKKAPLLGDEIKAAKLYRVHEGQFIYGRLNAYEGAFAVIDGDYVGGHVSNEFPVFECDHDRILPEFLLAYFSTPAVWEALKRKVTGIGGGAGNRRIRLKEGVLLSDEIWLPPMDWQYKIKSTAEKLAASRADREAIGLELDALLPSILDRAFKGEL